MNEFLSLLLAGSMLLNGWTGGAVPMTDTIHLEAEHKPLMIAHRGLSGLEAENTASAFVAAAQRSYFGIETDVHRTGDGQFIIIHDDSTLRVAGEDMTVEETPFETLRGLQLLDTDGQKGRRDLMMPSLAEYIGICRKYGKTAVLEIKNHMEGEDLDRIVEIIREAEYLEGVIFISFDLPNLIHLRGRLPDQPIQYLTVACTQSVMDTLKTWRLDLDILYSAVTPEMVESLHARGVRVNVWTVNTPEDARRLMDCGVDFITTNILE